METESTKPEPANPMRKGTPEDQRLTRNWYFILALIAWACAVVIEGIHRASFSTFVETTIGMQPLAVILGILIASLVLSIALPVMWGILTVISTLYPEILTRPTGPALVFFGFACVYLIIGGRAWARAKGRHPDWGYLMAFPAIGALVLWRLGSKGGSNGNQE